MAGNTRGKLKEEFEGIHRNFLWIKVHIEKALILIKEKHPKLTIGIKALDKGCDLLDKAAQGIYGKI